MSPLDNPAFGEVGSKELRKLDMAVAECGELLKDAGCRYMCEGCGCLPLFGHLHLTLPGASSTRCTWVPLVMGLTSEADLTRSCIPERLAAHLRRYLSTGEQSVKPEC